MKKTRCWQVVLLLVILVLCVVFIFFNQKFHFFKQGVYTAEDFGFHNIVSEIDEDKDGIDDYHDIVLNAREYVESKPTYKSKYYDGGYPNDQYGVCTDVIWKALKGAGYSLKDKIDADIKNAPEVYTNVSVIDANIDFRRVLNLKVFFDRNVQKMTLDKKEVESWQPGDIVLTSTHIMILSDKRNKEGLPFIIHHDTMGARERNEIDNYNLIGHYRFTSNKK